MKRLAAVYSGSAQHHRALNEPKYQRWIADTIYLPDLDEADLTRFDGVLIPDRLHHGKVEAAAENVLRYLDQGGTVMVFNGGEPPPTWLPGLKWAFAPTNFWWWLEPGASLGLTAPSPDHALFRRITLADATWHYHGVLTPPAGAEAVVGLEAGGSLLYVDRVSTKGTILATTLDPLFHFGSYFMPATERFLDGFLPWVVEDLLN
jgi:hypothetical protein